MPMKRLTICERDWNFDTVAFVSVKQTSGDAVVHCNIHVYSPVICPAHGGVCVSNPWPKPGLSLYEWRQRSERMPVKPQPWSLRYHSRRNSIVTPQWCSEWIHTLTRAESPPFTFLSDHRHRYALSVSSPVRKHESQSWHSTCPKCLQDGMKWIDRRLGQQTTKKKLTLTRGLNRQNVNVEWKYKTDTNSKHTFGDMTYHLPGTYLSQKSTNSLRFFWRKCSITDISNLSLVGSLIHSNFTISFSLCCVSPLVGYL